MKFLKRVANFLHWSTSSTVKAGKSEQSLTGYEKELLLKMNSTAAKTTNEARPTGNMKPHTICRKKYITRPYKSERNK